MGAFATRSLIDCGPRCAFSGADVESACFDSNGDTERNTGESIRTRGQWRHSHQYFRQWRQRTTNKTNKTSDRITWRCRQHGGARRRDAARRRRRRCVRHVVGTDARAQSEPFKVRASIVCAQLGRAELRDDRRRRAQLKFKRHEQALARLLLCATNRYTYHYFLRLIDVS